MVKPAKFLFIFADEIAWWSSSSQRFLSICSLRDWQLDCQTHSFSNLSHSDPPKNMISESIPQLFNPGCKSEPQQNCNLSKGIFKYFKPAQTYQHWPSPDISSNKLVCLPKRMIQAGVVSTPNDVVRNNHESNWFLTLSLLIILWMKEHQYFQLKKVQFSSVLLVFFS